MSRTDFFDEDLVKHRDSVKRIRMGPGDETMGTVGENPNSEDIPARPVSDLNLSRMARHKEEISAQVAQAMEELERLRTRQEDLERERRGLVDLREKQHAYEETKREMHSHLTQSLVRLEKEELQAEQLKELLGATRLKFKALLEEVESLQEEEWPEEHIREELGKGLAVIEQVRREYHKALARVEGAVADTQRPASGKQPVIVEERHAYDEEAKGFGYWLKVGLAASLPLMVTLSVLALLFYLMEMGFI